MGPIARAAIAAAGATVVTACVSRAQTIAPINPPQPTQLATSPVVSPDGEFVVGTILDFSGANQNLVFRRRADGQLTIIEPPAPYTTHVCRGTTEHADLVLCTADNGAGPAYLWSEDGLFSYPFGTTTDNLIRGISTDGRVLIGSNTTDPFTWTADGGFTYLTRAFNFRSRPSALTHDGAMAVGDCPQTSPPDPTLLIHAAAWAGGAPTLLHAPNSTALGVNGDGSVIAGDVRTLGGQPGAYRWGTASGPVPFPQGPQGASAQRVSADGRVIAGTGLSLTPDGFPYNGPWVWTQETGALRLEDYLAARGVDLTGWFLGSVQSLSIDGMVMAGTGTYDGVDTAFVVDLRRDTDGDAIYDGWESAGVPYMDAAGVVQRYVLEGANPLRKDLYIEVDSMAGLAPPVAAVARLIAAFDQAPVTVGAAGGLPGIALHVQVDDGDLELSTAPSSWSEFHQRKAAFFGTAAERALADWPWRRRAKAMVYRYAQSVHTLPGGVTGMAELASSPPRRASNDLMVALGPAQGASGFDDLYSGVFMHQLGHTLGLFHAGDQQAQSFAPGNFSVMNALWQGPHAYGPPGGLLDYSRQAHAPLIESQLDEQAGIGVADGFIGPVFARTVNGPARCGETAPNTWGACAAEFSPGVCINYAALGGPVDWNNDGVIAPAGQPVCADLNNDGDAADQFASVNEWALIRLGFRDSPSYSDAVEGAPADPCPTLALHAQLAALPPPPSPPQCPVTPPTAGGPMPAESCPVVAGVFEIQPAGTGPFTIQWRRFDEALGDWVVLTDGTMPHATQVSGSNGPLLVIQNASAADLGALVVRISYLLTDACGQATPSGDAQLVIEVPAVAVTHQPAWLRACQNSVATLSVEFTPASAGIQWQLQDAADPDHWSDVTDGPSAAACAQITGAQSASLHLQWTPGDTCPLTRVFRARVTGVCGAVTVSDPVTLDSRDAPDFNGDGDIGTDADIEAFFACLGGTCCPACGSPDFNNDGDIGTDADIDLFFRVLGGGGC